MRYFFIPFFFLFILGSCSTERKVAKKLDGIWTVVSFQGTQDSLQTEYFEFMGDLFASATINFGNYDLSESEGIYEITLEDASNGLLDKDSGTYMLNDSGDKVTLIRLDGMDVLDLDIGDDRLFLEGPYLGSSVLIEAELR